MQNVKARLQRWIQKLTSYIRSRRKRGVHSPVAKKNRTGARAKVVKIRRALRERRVDWNGHPALSNRKLKQAARIGARYGLVVTSTTDGTHAVGSYHYSGRGLDIASGSSRQMVSAQRAILRELGAASLLEVFGPDNASCVKNGAVITLAEGSALENQHDNHVHVAA